MKYKKIKTLKYCITNELLKRGFQPNHETNYKLGTTLLIIKVS